jgi:hypothetical protein
MAEMRKRRRRIDHPVNEDHRHRVLEHGERERAEEQHRHEQHQADDAAILDEAGQLDDHRGRFARYEPFQVAAKRREELLPGR